MGQWPLGPLLLSHTAPCRSCWPDRVMAFEDVAEVPAWWPSPAKMGLHPPRRSTHSKSRSINGATFPVGRLHGSGSWAVELGVAPPLVITPSNQFRGFMLLTPAILVTEGLEVLAVRARTLLPRSTVRAYVNLKLWLPPKLFGSLGSTNSQSKHRVTIMLQVIDPDSSDEIRLLVR